MSKPNKMERQTRFRWSADDLALVERLRDMIDPRLSRSEFIRRAALGLLDVQVYRRRIEADQRLGVSAQSVETK